jgi:hypothetical protein
MEHDFINSNFQKYERTKNRKRTSKENLRTP